MFKKLLALIKQKYRKYKEDKFWKMVKEEEMYD
jgi:hypothetical protein